MTRPIVALDALLLGPRPTGVGRAILDLTAALADADRGYDFLVLCTHPEMLGHVDGQPGWRLLPCPGARGGALRKAWWTQMVMPQVLRREGVSLLHALQFVAPWSTPCPTVVTVHDLGFRHFPDTVEQPRRAYYRVLVPHSLGRAAAVVCNSAATANDVRASFPAVAALVHATPFGTPRWVEGRTVATERRPDAPFLFVGTLEPRKNVAGLLKAYHRFRQERRGDGRMVPALHLVGGRGWLDHPIRDLLAPLVDAGHVVLLGYCGPEELWQQYRLARALLLPSLHEGFGFPILEAMSAGLPVLTANRGAMAEVGGDAALLVDPESTDALVDSLHLLVDDPTHGRDLVQRGFRRRRQFTWQRTASMTADVYRRVLDEVAGQS